MIYTVTLNPALDKTLCIPGFAAGSVNRVKAQRLDAGGKGINVSKAIKALGGESRAYAPIGGQAGQTLKELVSALGIELLYTEIQGETRTNIKITDALTGQTTDINSPGPVLDTKSAETIYERVLALPSAGDTVVLSGSLPEGFGTDRLKALIDGLKLCGVSVLADLSGAALKAVAEAGPCLIKPNIFELSELADGRFNEINEIISCAKGLQARFGIDTVVVSMGENGLLTIAKSGVYRAFAPKVEVKSTVGAGDAVTGAFAYGLENNMSIKQITALAAAAGAAAVAAEGTQMPDSGLIKALMNSINVARIEEL